MTRGIHLKHLTASDLDLLGLPEEFLQGESNGATGDPGARATTLVEEADPVLAGVTQEIRQALEETLQLLDQALAQSQSV